MIELCHVVRNIRPYKGSEDPDFQPGGPVHSKSPPIVKGVEEADRALAMGIEERLSLVAELQPSDDDEEEEEVMGKIVPTHPMVL